MIKSAIMFFFLLGTLLLPVLSGAGGIEPCTCRNGTFPNKQNSLLIAVFSGTAGSRLYFHGDDEGCPDNGARCRTKAYLIPGNEVLVNKLSGGWACAWFQGKKHETVGWVRTENLEFQAAEKNRNTGPWIGTWKRCPGCGEITVSKRGGSLRVRGDAIWGGGKFPGGHYVAHTGEIDGEIKPKNGRARLADGKDKYDCVVDFTLIGRYLVVADNGNCGGANVSFSDVYTKAK